MSNKISDKNVAKDIEFLKSNEADALYFRGNPKLKSAIQNILAEREQDKKRIQELEEENAKYKSIDFLFKVQSDANYIDMRKIYFEWLDSIPKQAVIDVIQEYKGKIEKYNEYREQGKETDVEYYENIANTIVVQVLQELLEGERK